MLGLTRNNYATIIDNRPAFLGMLKRTQSYVTWGEPSKETAAMLIKEKGRTAGDKKLTDEYAQKKSFKSVEELAEAVFDCRTEYRSLPNIKPYFRLHPPKKGFKGKIKQSYTSGGELGYRKGEINELLKRMI